MLALTCLAAGSRPWAWLARRRFALLVAMAIALRMLLLFAAPDPDIDVEVLQRVGAQGFLSGKNPYALVFPSPYQTNAVFDQYCYPPGTVYAAAAGWALFKDVRTAWLACDLLGALFLYLLARATRPGPEGRMFRELLPLVFLFMPRSLHVLEKAWTEPLAVAALGAFAWARATRRSPGVVGALLSFWLCSKQYVVLALPAALRWRRWSARAWCAGAAVSRCVVRALHAVGVA